MAKNQTHRIDLQGSTGDLSVDKLLQRVDGSTFADSADRLEQLSQQNKSLQKALKAANRKLEETQAQLAQAGKLATLGTLGAEIAHELNNPLTVVSAEADEILDAIGNGHLAKKFATISVTNIKKHAEKMRVIVDHIRRYSRDEKDAPWEKLTINDPIKDAFILLRSQLENSGVSIKLCLDANLPQIWGHVNKLESIFQNLIGNAADAFASVEDGREKKLSISTSVEGQNRIVVKVIDNAGGMPEEVRSQIFNPFFTSKKAGKGTGLGLFMVQNLVKEHRGIIKVDSRIGIGSEFTLIFPLERRINDAQE